MRKFLPFFIFMLLPWISSNAFAAVGCDLNDPDRDVKRLFPASTSYKTAYLSVGKQGGESQYSSTFTVSTMAREYRSGSGTCRRGNIST